MPAVIQPSSFEPPSPPPVDTGGGDSSGLETRLVGDEVSNGGATSVGKRVDGVVITWGGGVGGDVTTGNGTGAGVTGASVTGLIVGDAVIGASVVTLTVGGGVITTASVGFIVGVSVVGELVVGGSMGGRVTLPRGGRVASGGRVCGGINTASITCITPLLATISAVVTVASFTLITPFPTPDIVTSSPFNVVTGP